MTFTRSSGQGKKQEEKKGSDYGRPRRFCWEGGFYPKGKNDPMR